MELFEGQDDLTRFGTLGDAPRIAIRAGRILSWEHRELSNCGERNRPPLLISDENDGRAHADCCAILKELCNVLLTLILVPGRSDTAKATIDNYVVDAVMDVL